MTSMLALLSRTSLSASKRLWSDWGPESFVAAATAEATKGAAVYSKVWDHATCKPQEQRCHVYRLRHVSAWL